MNDTTASDAWLSRGVAFTPQGVDGYHECWYPLCLSSEVKPGTVRGFRFLNGKLVVFRNAAGEVSVMSAYCRHLGVDLSLAKVTGDNIRCPYHHWEYDRGGQCVKTAIGDTPPKRARLFRFPSAENLGVVWVYNGEKPAYDLPRFPVDESELVYYTCRSIEAPMDPFMLYSNTMDLQHLISLHGAKFDTMPTEFDVGPRNISYTQDMTVPMLGRTTQQVKLHGTNCITLCSQVRGRPSFLMSAGLCLQGPRTRTFNISATLKRDAGDGALSRSIERLKAWAHVRMLDAFGKKLNADDDPIFRTISPRIDSLSGSDLALRIYFDYIAKYPRSRVAEDLIRNDYLAAAPAAH
ncbi:MAG: Rieske (2Fe-2S) protein [Gammaproteobacteria bacterium]|nr:Rieske (2Fe-2S) protein [Gammaproteobacteria bacterium]